MGARSKEAVLAARLITRLDTPGDILALKILGELAKLGKPGLGKFPRSSRARDLVLSSLRDPRMTVRHQAVLAIRDSGRLKRARFLIPLLQDESGGIRLNVIDALARLKCKEAIADLKSLQRDEKLYVRKAIARALLVLEHSEQLKRPSSIKA